MSSSIRSLASKVRALAVTDTPFDEAEQLLRATTKPADRVDTATQARRERREYADLLGLTDTRALARETRLRRWLGLDIAPPPDDEVNE